MISQSKVLLIGVHEEMQIFRISRSDTKCVCFEQVKSNYIDAKKIRQLCRVHTCIILIRLYCRAECSCTVIYSNYAMSVCAWTREMVERKQVLCKDAWGSMYTYADWCGWPSECPELRPMPIYSPEVVGLAWLIQKIFQIHKTLQRDLWKAGRKILAVFRQQGRQLLVIPITDS